MAKGYPFQQMVLERTVMCGRQDSKNVSLNHSDYSKSNIGITVKGTLQV